jgi:glycerophosphoryl diester phosphodiesterase
MKEKQKKLAPYIQALPSILLYQIVTKLVIAAWVFLMGRLFRVLLNSMGRVAVSSGDFLFLFTSWKGLLIIVLGLVSLYV